MAVWKDFEIDCTNYLNSNFGKYATFIHVGESNSRIADIKVNNNKNEEFYIEAKHAPAQCGQFVLTPNIQLCQFEYSLLNFNKLNEYSKQIIEFMNKHFEIFKEAGTAGKSIVFENCEEVFNNWVKQYYEEKNVQYFITNNFMILPIEEFEKYFIVTAKYRVKRSGSTSAGKGNKDSLQNYLEHSFHIQSVEMVGDKIFVQSKEELHNTRFILNGYEYMLSKRDDKYEVRKLSNTFNANVIFSIALREGQEGMTIEQFAEQFNA